MKKIKKFFADFKKFITKGDVLSLAVGVIIGAAFGKIVSSLVGDVIMPLVTRAMGATSLADLSITLRPEVVTDGVVVQEALTLNWGNFLQNIIDFLIIAFIVFVFVRALDKAKATTLKLAAAAREKLEKDKKEENEEEPLEVEQKEEEKEEEKVDTSDNTLKSIESLLVEIRESLKKE